VQKRRSLTSANTRAADFNTRFIDGDDATRRMTMLPP
jgi:hypothetical protein